MQITVLGKPRIVCRGQPLTAERISAKGQALLFYLATTGHSCSRQAAAGLLWGDLPEERARGNLRLTLTKLRKPLGDYMIITRQSLAFNLAQPHWFDAAHFTASAEAPEKADGDRLQAALALYAGDFLDDFHLQDAPDFEAWVLMERARFQQMALASLAYLAQRAQDAADWENGIACTRRILTLEPWREEAHRQLMQLLAESGQRSAALAQFEICCRTLDDELGVEPSAATINLYKEIKQGTWKEARLEDAAPEEAHVLENNSVFLPPRHNLPQSLTPFIGRTQEMAQIAKLLTDPNGRLLTLVGPGGVGKTRLAVTAAMPQVDNFRNGVRFVSLRDITPAGASEAVELLITSIANALAYTFTAPRPARELLLEHLAGQELLLVLDNVEPLVAPRLAARSKISALLLDVLAYCRGVKLLLTSRERLDLSAEWLVEVHGLPYPPTLARDTLATYPAVSLFTGQARRIRPDFDLTKQENAVTRICQLVAGFPLALELAANWLRLLSCAEIAVRLEQDLALLPSAAPAAGPHSSMRAVLDSSWEMLTVAEQEIFSCLSVFQTGFTLSAAQQVAGATLPVLNGLLNKSMLRRQEDGRYVLHDLLRQYGATHLAAAPTMEATTRQKYCRFYMEFLQARHADLADETNRTAIIAVDEEIENVRAAWEWLLAGQDPDALTAPLESLCLYYARKGWFQEAVSALEQACALVGTSSAQRGRWTLRLGEAYFNLGDFPAASHHLENALALLDRPIPMGGMKWAVGVVEQILQLTTYRLVPRRSLSSQRAVENRLDAIRACERLCQIYWFQCRSNPMLYSMLRSLNLCEAVKTPTEQARIYSTAAIGLGTVPLPALADAYVRRALDASRGPIPPSARTWTLENVALYHLGQGKWEAARISLLEAMEIAQRSGDGRRWEECTGLLAQMETLHGRYADSLGRQRQTMASAQRRGDTQFQFHESCGLAENALRLGQLDEAVNWLARAEALLAGDHGLVEEIKFYGITAQIRLQQADMADALAAAQQAADRIAQVRPTAFYTFEGYASVAEVYLHLWEVRTSNTSIAVNAKELAQCAQRACKHLETFGRAMPVAQPRAWLHRGLYCWLSGRTQKGQQAWAQSLALAQQLEMPYEVGRAHYEMGRHLSPNDLARRTHLIRACTIFKELGTVHELGLVLPHLEFFLT